MKKASLLVILCLFACTSETSLTVEENQKRQAVFDGYAASIDDVGATVALLERGDLLCTGTLIAPSVVLTAAHCLEQSRARDLEVAVGLTQLDTIADAQRFEVNDVIMHDDYDAFRTNSNDPAGLSEQHDIGLLLLESPVTQVSPAPLLSVEHVELHVVENTPVVISGFGMVSLNDFNVPPLQIGNSRFIRRANGEVHVGGIGYADACYGDSGGPLYIDLEGQRFVFGATSRKPDNATRECGDGTIYTFASDYIGWIEQNANGLYRFEDQMPAPIAPPAEEEEAEEEPVVADEQEPVQEEPAQEEEDAEEEAEEEPAQEEGTYIPGTTCGGKCTGGSLVDECRCDQNCAYYGDCCEDRIDTCDGNTPINTNDEALPASDSDASGIWTCAIETRFDDLCDCGCGTLDPACADATLGVCDVYHCDDGTMSMNDNTLCIDDASLNDEPFVLKQSCEQSAGLQNSAFVLFCAILLGTRRKKNG